jgi:hypothetical protein
MESRGFFWIRELDGENKKYIHNFSEKRLGNRLYADWIENRKIVVRRVLGKVIISVIESSCWTDKSGVRVHFFFGRGPSGRVENYCREAGQTRNWATRMSYMYVHVYVQNAMGRKLTGIKLRLFAL